MSNSTLRESSIAKIEKNRDDLEALTETDLPCADLAEALLEVAGDGK